MRSTRSGSMPQLTDKILRSLPIKELKRIDAALEGDWSSTVTTVWSPEQKEIDFSKIAESHPTFRPSLELYFDGAWVGIHCFKRMNNQNVFDKKIAVEIIHRIEEMLA